MERHASERGFALAGAIFALVVIASLIAGAFFAARQEINIGRSSATYEKAFAAAETGLDYTVATWNTGTFNSLAVGDSQAASGTVPSSGGSWTAVVVRLNREVFLVRATGLDPSGAAQRQLATLTRLQRLIMNVNAGLTTRGNLRLGGSSFIDGYDDAPDDWDCPSTSVQKPGVITKDSASITTSGCGGWSCVQGDPKIEQDPTITDSTFYKYGEVDYNELVQMATLQLPGGQTWTQVQPSDTVQGSVRSCRSWVQKNWGEPWRDTGYVAACTGYFPIIHVNGDAQLSNGRGQGILLVDGNLSVQGQFQFYGPVVVRGQFDTQGTGNHFNGGVLAANANLQTSDVLGNATVTYSSCAINRALSNAVPARQFARRAWADLVQ